VTDATAYEPPFQLTVSPGFGRWLADADVSLAFAVPPAKLVFVGRDPDGEVAVFERTFDKTMGLARDGTTRLHLATRSAIWRFEHAEPSPQDVDAGYDRCYVPREVRITGNVNTHDVGVDPRGGPAGGVVFVATRFSCLARPSDTLSFEPLWQPPFVTGFRAGDRCHLNGVAMGAEGPEYVTAVATTDALERWRWHRNGGGVVIHVPTGEIVATGFSMPHSPRLYQGELWLTDSGSGELCRVDPHTGHVERVAFAPGFLRGMTFVGDYAVVGSSKPREGDLYSGLPLDDALARHQMLPRLGIFVIQLSSGRICEWMFIEGEPRELFDVVALPGVRRPTALGIVGNELYHSAWFDARALERTESGWRSTDV
jgi:uncharacterized protein (TIGR03032 family)